MLSSESAKLAPLKKAPRRKRVKKNQQGAEAAVQQLMSRAINSSSLVTGIAHVPETMYETSEKIVKAIHTRDDFKFPDDNSSVGSMGSSVTGRGHRTNRYHQDNFSVDASLSSQRSYTSNMSMDSEYSQKSQLTTREMVSQITARAKNHQAPPNYVPSFEELGPVHLSWNKKMPRRHRRKVRGSKSMSALPESPTIMPAVHSHPPINILPCMQSVELILACADERTRKQTRAVEMKKIKCEEKVQQINQTIELKFTRAERYAAALEHQQRQIAWIKIVVVKTYLARAMERFQYLRKNYKFVERLTKAAMVLQKFIRRCVGRREVGPMGLEFLKKLKGGRARLVMYTRILKKKVMAKRIMTFLTEFKNNHQIPTVVKKYMASVRKVQAAMRDFLVCKRNKIESLGKVWDRLEWRYIKRKLDERRAQKRGLNEKISAFNAAAAEKEAKELTTHQGPSANKEEYVSKTKNEIKNQSKQWNKIDARMEGRIVALKECGVIAEEDEEEVIGRLRLATNIRNCIMRNMLERLRREFYHNEKQALKKQMEADSVFGASHAAALLRGDVSNLNRIINEKFNKRLVALAYKPFLLFRSISTKDIYDKVREAHKVNETFKLHIQSQQKKASVQLHHINHGHHAATAAAVTAQKIAAINAAKEAEALRVKNERLCAL